MCLNSATSVGVRAVTFARADSAGRAVLAQAGIDPRGECVTGIAKTDSSVILSYSAPHLPTEAPPGKRVLQYGGGVVIEVLASGRARWLYGTQ